MPQLPVLSGAEIIRALSKVGYQVLRQRGSHVRLSCQGRKNITVPDYETISKGLLRKILRDAEISSEDFLKLI